MFCKQITGLIAGEALAIAAPCRIDADGLVYMCGGTSGSPGDVGSLAGFTARVVASGEPVTLFGEGARFQYGASLTPGAILYVGATAGRLDDGSTAFDDQGVALVLTATDIQVIRANGKQEVT
jgi:hypothetical protein